MHLQGDVCKSDILAVIEETIDSLQGDLKELSLAIHGEPELGFQECFAHGTFARFMDLQGGWDVKRHYHLQTAWVATYTNGEGGPVLGINSEMDALPAIGHACGHNLIGMAGVAVACAVKAAMKKLDINGKVILLGTPAEENGNGKVLLYNEGAYDEMDVCLMCHPAPGTPFTVGLSSSLALVKFEVRYTGKSAHAGMSPWEGKNALDAVVAAYTSIGLLRQQIKPTHRTHGVFSGEDWAPNVIPDNAKAEWVIRAPNITEAHDTTDRVKKCFTAAATATGTEVKFCNESEINELIQNKVLGDELVDIVEKRYGDIAELQGMSSASTDFGSISHWKPAIHPGFAITTSGGNHTKEFEEAAGTNEAHEACFTMCKALAYVGMRVMTDRDFLDRVKYAFEKEKRHRHC